MQLSICLLLFVLLAVGSHGQGAADGIVWKQARAFLAAVESKDIATIVKMFHTNPEDIKNIGNVFTGFHGAVITNATGVFHSKIELVGTIHFMIANTEIKAEWLMVTNTESPTGWKVWAVGGATGSRKFDFSDTLYCWVYLFKCIADTAAVIFG